MKQLFTEHISTLLAECTSVLSDFGADAIIFGSGSQSYFFDDDQAMPFRENAFFSYFCPLKGPGNFIAIVPHKKPLLVQCVPDDYWHAPAEKPDDPWADCFDIKSESTALECFTLARRLCGEGKKIVFIGGQTQFAQTFGIECNPFLYVSRLNWKRSFKTNYEIFCLSRANELAAPAHNAAKECFIEGGSEFEIYMAFLHAAKVTEQQLPYGAIVGINRNAAILHYEKKETLKQIQLPLGSAPLLLIDAGVKFQNYGSDITRTHLKLGSRLNSSEAIAFAGILSELQSIQERLCNKVAPGVTFACLHLEMHFEIACLLLRSEIVVGLKGEALSDSSHFHEIANLLVTKEISHHFIPHGIGHLLGIFVHDVAGHTNANGQPLSKLPLIKNLRSSRTLEPSMTLTIEPGIYFIESLLHKLKQRLSNESMLPFQMNWKLIENLKPFGGIRIEDNVVVTSVGHSNLTRQFLN